MNRFLILALLSVFALSCAHVISKELREKAVKDVPFKAVRLDPEKHKGSVFIWGGFIANFKRSKEETVLEVVQNPIDRYGNIIDEDKSQGRFLAVYKGELDPLIYERGRLITAAGELTGTKELKKNKHSYIYPVMEVQELYLWKEEPTYVPYPFFYYPPYLPYYPWPYYPSPIYP